MERHLFKKNSAGRRLTAGAAALAFILAVVSCCFGQDDATSAQQLLDAARNGRIEQMESLLKTGASVNAKDPSGRTPLHLAAAGGHQATAQVLLEHGADISAKDNEGHTPLDAALSNGHEGTARFLQTHGAIPGAASDGAFHPDAKYTTAEAFSKAIGESAVMLDSQHVSILASKKHEKAISIVLPYLVRAYDELYKITGVHTKYKILVYAFPKGFPGVRGGTSGCVISYTDENLQLENQEEWKRFHVPHVSGYIEELAHNFVWASGAEFGWEMIGWSLSAEVTETVAGNPVHQGEVAQARQNQAQTYRRYMAAGQTFPADLPGNQADRIHAYLLRKCELQYGPDFWKDLFKEVRKARDSLFRPEARDSLDARYRITVECLDRLPGLNFTKLLEESGISTTVAVQSLKPESAGWNRKLR